MHIKAVGKHLIDPYSESPLILRGFNFTQNYWMPSDTILKTGKDDQAYKFAKRIGANSLRLTVRHSFLEPYETPLVYSAEALKWLDLQIEHAKNNGLYISLALVLPHGGDWLDKKDGKDFRLWHQLDFQMRFIEMWKTLACRYAKESAILGYDLFNVPVTDDETGEAYYQLLQKTIQCIRSVDPNHMIIVSKLYGCRGEIDHNDAAAYYRKLDCDNLLYDYHFYDPVDYTHQYAEWVGNNSDGGSYPEESILKRLEMVNRCREIRNT